jgi:S1-C subfamily serine protease
VIVNADGAVLTALHVVDGAGQIAVDFADGTRAAAQVTARQPEHDVAVLAVDRLPEVVVPAVLAGPPPVGDTVFAVGNPLGLRGSLTAGVVSATGRTINPPAGPALDGLIQFDAAVNPGNSGGPLLNRAGQVVGVVTALANPANQDFFVGVGFAVPIATAGGAAGGPQQ